MGSSQIELEPLPPIPKAYRSAAEHLMQIQSPDPLVDKNLGVEELAFALEQLDDFGYLKEFRPSQPSTEAVHIALAIYQEWNGIPSSSDTPGRLTLQTLEDMLEPRCGLEDLPRGFYEMAPRDRGRKTKCRWPKKVDTITYAFESGFSSSFAEAVERAMAAWEPYVPLQFKVSDGDPDLVIGMRPKTDSDISLKKPRIAHADYPPPCRKTKPGPLPLHFKQGVSWSSGKKPQHFNLFNLALHELGHVLGLRHNSTSKVMKKGAKRNQKDRSVDEDSKKALKKLYA